MKQARKPISKDQLGLPLSCPPGYTSSAPSHSGAEVQAAAHAASLPYASGSHTSLAAATSMRSSAETYRHKVLEFVRGRGPHGATDEEIATGLAMNPNTARPRRIELVDKFKLIVDSGETRPTRSGRKAVVYVTPENARA